MNEILYRKTTKDDMEILMKLRLEMLREVNDLSGEYEYDEKFISESRRYFESGEQTTVIALDGQTPVGCASLSYIWIMPTFSHPTGNRAHLMNVYTRADHRRRGISKKMVEILIEEAKENGVTEKSIQRILYTLPDASHLTGISFNRGYYHDRQNLGLERKQKSCMSFVI